ncbi:MAG: deoxyribodipyrimidine photo-lyase [bacterium]|nr:deoxyribodipyrimidine photo-lyase [bacterium]
MNEPLIIHWFRQDLRLADNPALHRAAAAGRVLPVFVLDDVNAGSLRRGAASRWWLHHSLAALDRSLQGRLVLLRGDALDLVPALAAQVGATAVHWNRCYEPWRIARDTKLKEKLAAQGVAAVSTNGSLLWEPWDVSNAAGKPYQVFTPFYRKGCLNAGAPRMPLPRPEPLTLAGPPAGALPLAALELLPRIRWDRQLEPHWQIGEEAATARLASFLAGGLRGYREGRDFPARPHTSRLSPALHFGEVSPNQLWYGARAGAEGPDLDHFLNELAWREFSYALLYHHPTLPTDNLQPSFDAFPWDDEETLLRAWQRGGTGIPFVDAGMRELWQTGWMHNRVRMVTGSFLVKNLLLHWQHGEAWFRDCLVDADLAANSASWQWVAGCGADAAPYFRIFNPVLQGRRFDPDGAYTRRFVPELAGLPDRWLFAPWEAPAAVLQAAGVTLGKDYPRPVVDLATSRQRALAAYAESRGGTR